MAWQMDSHNNLKIGWEHPCLNKIDVSLRRKILDSKLNWHLKLSSVCA